jgi:hypothetical protein
MTLLSIFTRSLRDFLTKEMLLLSLAPFLIALFIWSTLFLGFSAEVDSVVNLLLGYIPFSDIAYIHGIADFLLTWILFLLLLLSSSMIILSFISDRIVSVINKRHYHFASSGFGNLSQTLQVSIRSNMVFLFYYILLLPTLFIPFVNIAVHLFLWQRLLKHQMMFDALSGYASKEQYKSILQKEKGSLTIMALLASMLFFIPFLGTFVLIFQLILFTHFGLSRLDKGLS